MSRLLTVGLAIAALAGCSTAGREGEQYTATDTPTATATAQAQKNCAGAGLAPREGQRFQVYSSDQGRMVDRLYYTCAKPGR